MMNQIKTIEDLSLNAWPSHQIEIYDGWLLRFSYFYTHRTNSVEQIGASSIPIPEKIAYCEDIYKRWGTPTIFKISPLLDPSFDAELENRGYEIQHTTQVMSTELNTSFAVPSNISVHISREITPQWLEGLFTLKETTNSMHRKIVPSMYEAIPKDIISASILIDGKVAATGLGILDRDYIGLYAIHVDTAYRHMHWGEAICKTILNAGIENGARRAYLQVVAGNAPAKHLYEKLGFQDIYTYWFRVRKNY